MLAGGSGPLSAVAIPVDARGRVPFFDGPENKRVFTYYQVAVISTKRLDEDKN